MRAVLAALVALAACGDNKAPAPDASSDAELLAKLRALPHVADATEMATQTIGYHYIVLHFTQPVDHADPSSPTFLQEVSLIAKDTTSPLIVHTSGYWDYYTDHPVELTVLLAANQISIEHRYFATSRPANPDWSKLTIEQMADDEHVIVSELRTVFTGKALSTGGSKGGMTAIFYRRFFPDDVDGTVPYVAPISFAAPDTRYPPFIDMVGTDTCRQAVRDVATELLKNRRAAMEQRTMDQATANNFTYTRVLIGPAVESAIDSLEWSFWQYYGITECPNVPALTATDDAMFKWLDKISPVSESDDNEVGLFDAYYYQAYFQLGYPDGGAAYLKPYLMYKDADYANSLPTAQPMYDGGTAMHDIDNFVEQQGDRFIFVYGEWDPWTAGKFTLGNANDALELIQAQGTHNSHLTRLATTDRDAAFAKLAAWTGVTPQIPGAREMPVEPVRHVPPALLRTSRLLR
ncbi:MAG: aminopeptidase [Deltaproteobacteria bacterium]|nr:aminopeptidase [Deltaproteobacteria bacterium]